jgi:uncharacterized membrane protein
MSVVASLVAIAALFDAARLTVGPDAALGACLLMAVAVPQVQYAQEARDYATLLAEGMLACAAIVRLRRRGGGVGWAAILCLAVCAMALTHYFAAGAIVALALYTGLQLRGRARDLASIALLAAVLLGALLWGHEFWIQRANFGGQKVAWLHETSRHPTAVTIARVLLLPARYLFDAQGRIRVIGIVAAAVYVVPIFALRRRPGLLLWWLWLGCTVGVVAALDLARTSRELAQVRYTLLAAPAAYVLIAAAGQWLGRGGSGSWWIGRLAPLAALAVCVLALPRQAYHPEWRANWRGVGQLIAARRAPDELLCCVGTSCTRRWLTTCIRCLARSPCCATFRRRRPTLPMTLWAAALRCHRWRGILGYGRWYRGKRTASCGRRRGGGSKRRRCSMGSGRWNICGRMVTD